MDKKLILTVSTMAALTVSIAALMIGCGSQKQDPTGPSNTQTTADIPDQTDDAGVQIPVVGEEGDIEIILPPSQTDTAGQGGVEIPTPSTGVTIQDSTVPSGDKEQTLPSTTEPQTSAPSQPTTPAAKYPTMKEYEAMTVEDQKYFREVTLGGDLNAFLAWVTKARQEEQDGEHFEITDGTVDIGELLKP